MVRWFGVVGALVLLMTAVSACGGGDNEDNSGADNDSGTPTLELIVVGKDERFSPATLEAAAGSVTVKFDNQDDNILHNIRFYKGDSADGQFVRKTDIKRGPRTDTLKLKLEPGSYFYDCEVHPATMTGTLTVR